MSNDPFVILGVSANATQSEIFEAYKKLRDRYSDERFLEGEAGAEAARKLNELYEAYNTAMEISARRASISEGKSGYYDVENAIRSKDFREAQRLLDNCSERDAEWHYLQSVVHYNNNWYAECKKQLEIAIEKDPSNEKYRRSLEKIKHTTDGTQPHQEEWFNAQRQSQQTYQQNANAQHTYTQRNRSTSDNICNACSACICADCCCECMGGDLISCC